MHRAGIVFHVDTDFRTRKLIFNTACTRSCLGSRVFPSDFPSTYVSSSFILGKYQFSNVTFECVTWPNDLNEIDGLVGMDFLKEHPMYFDYANQVAYIAPPDRYFERIPVTFTKRNDPMIDVLFEGGNTYSLKLDLGSSFMFSLGTEILNKISKTKYGTSRWHDFKGRKYESPIYTDSEIKIGKLKFYREFINQDSQEFHINATVLGEPCQFPGIIGLPILEKYNLFLDFPHSVIYSSKNLTLLQEAGLFSHHFLAIPFAMHPDGILLSIETDNGKYRLMFDTGASRTAIRAPHPDDTTQFRIMGHDFGRRFIKELDICSQFDFDGFLGMDFFMEYPIFIDYSNKIVFIDLKKDYSP